MIKKQLEIISIFKEFWLNGFKHEIDELQLKKCL